MLTTLYCDASWYHEEKVGGWAIWLRSEKGRIVRAGAVPDYCLHAYEAEFAAVFAGIHLALVSWPETKAILVRSDCDSALKLMTGRHQPRHEGARRLAEKVAEFRSSVRLLPRWVKGHQSGDSTEAWINRRVDRMAREAARAEVSRVQGLASSPAGAPARQEPTPGPET